MPGSLALTPEAVALPTSRPSKANQIYAALREAIVSGEIAPGASIDKNELCARFGVSRLPITTAVNRLAYDGLVLIEPQKGSFVAKIKLGDALQWMLARRALEAELAAECARRLPDASIDRLKRNLLYQQAAVGGDDYSGFLRLDVVFHQQLVDGLGLGRIGELLDSLRAHLDRIRRILLPEPGRMESTLAEHQSIFDAIVRRKPRQADQAMRTHLNVVLERLVIFEKQYPDFFGH